MVHAGSGSREADGPTNHASEKRGHPGSGSREADGPDELSSDNRGAKRDRPSNLGAGVEWHEDWHALSPEAKCKAQQQRKAMKKQRQKARKQEAGPAAEEAARCEKLAKSYTRLLECVAAGVCG